MLALVGAAATLLDAVATSTVSAATASAYLSAEFHSMPISTTLLTVLFLVALGVVALAGIRESASATAAVFVFHARIARSLFYAPRALTLTSPRPLVDCNGSTRGGKHCSLGDQGPTFYDFEAELGVAPWVRKRDRQRTILWRLRCLSWCYG